MEKSYSQIVYFDDLIRCFSILTDNTCEKEFLRYVSNQELIRSKCIETMNECKRLKTGLDTANNNISTLDSKLTTARQLVDEERRIRKKIETERDHYVAQLEEVRRILLSDPRHKLPDETKERLSFLHKTVQYDNREAGCSRFDIIDESDSTSLDFSFSRSGNDLDESSVPRTKTKTRRLSYISEETGTIKRNKCSNVGDNFTPTAPSVESLNSSSSDDIIFNMKKTASDQNFCTPIIERINSRFHRFGPQNAIISFIRQSCSYCTKRSRTILKCEYCGVLAHPECCDKIPLPCIPLSTPKKGVVNGISDYAPAISPMIPAIIVHCINEVEQRGLNEIGIYRISGSEAGVRRLKDKLLKGRNCFNLSDEDIHDICSFLKEFLRELAEPLVPQADWNSFKGVIFDLDKKKKLQQAISLLPQINRDTLAFIILHLQHVACSPSCKMPISNLSAVFGPIIIGYSKNEYSSAFSEMHTVNLIMEELLSLSPSYWSNLISVSCSDPKTPNTLRNTPSTESLTKKTTYNFLFTPGGRRKYFNTPPTQKLE